MNPFVDIHPVAFGPHLEADLDVTEAKAHEGGIIQLRVHLPAQLPADEELPRRFPAMVKVEPWSKHGTCIKINGLGARDDEGRRGDLYLNLRVSDAEGLATSTVPPPLPRPKQQPPEVPVEDSALAVPLTDKEDLAAQVEAARRLHREMGQGDPPPSSSSSSGEDEAPSTEKAVLFLGLGVATIVGGHESLAHIDSLGTWFSATFTGVLWGIGLWIIVMVLASVSAAILKALSEGLSEAALSFGAILAFALLMGFILGPTWARAGHGKDWRTGPAQVVMPHVEPLLASLGKFKFGTGAAPKRWQPPELPPHTWDDGPMPAEEGRKLVKIGTWNPETLPDGRVRVVCDVRNGTNGRLSSFTVKMSHDGAALGTSTFEAETPILPNSKGSASAVFPRSPPRGWSYVVTEVSLASFDRKAEFQQSLDSWLAD